jgi:glycosyltransferase involved in cell wall biosynthesis
MAAFLRERQFEGVEFLGSVPQRQLARLMSQSHVLVLPSVEDGFGLVLGQAMACGCPVICSENTAGEDLVDDGRQGFVVPIRDAQAIALRLDQLCQDDSLRKEMGAAARQKVAELGGWDDYGNNFGALCRELADCAGPVASGISN